MATLSEKWKNLTKEIKSTIQYKIESISLDIAIQVFKQMEKLNLNRKQLAERLNVNKSYISQILKGKNNLTIETLVKLSEVLNMKPEIKFLQLTEDTSNETYFRQNIQDNNILSDTYKSEIEIPLAAQLTPNWYLFKDCSENVGRLSNASIATIDRINTDLQNKQFSI